MRAIARKNIQIGGELYSPGDEFEYDGTPEQAEQDVEGGLIETKHVVVNFVKSEGPTLAELRADADLVGIKYNSKTTKAQLIEALEKATIKVAAEDAEIQPNGEVVVSNEGVAKIGEPTEPTDDEPPVNPEDDGA